MLRHNIHGWYDTRKTSSGTNQANLIYIRCVKKHFDKGCGLRKSEIIEAHESYKPYYSDLVIDLVTTSETGDNKDRMSTRERKTVKSSSSDKTSTESKPDTYKVL